MSEESKSPDESPAVATPAPEAESPAKQIDFEKINFTKANHTEQFQPEEPKEEQLEAVDFADILAEVCGFEGEAKKNLSGIKGVPSKESILNSYKQIGLNKNQADLVNDFVANSVRLGSQVAEQLRLNVSANLADQWKETIKDEYGRLGGKEMEGSLETWAKKWDLSLSSFHSMPKDEHLKFCAAVKHDIRKDQEHMLKSVGVNSNLHGTMQKGPIALGPLLNEGFKNL